jgi:hypothetical protein
MTLRRSLLVFAASIASVSTAYALGLRAGRHADTRVYELRTYTTNPGKLPALERRFAEHTMRVFERHGMRNEMYWIPTDSALRDNTLIYVISHESRDAADRNWKSFSADTAWRRIYQASEADGAILAKPPERVFMRTAAWSPAALRGAGGNDGR